MPERLYLIDGSGYIFRAYYAVQHLTAPDGFPTNALFGFTKMLLKLFKELKSSNIVMVFDSGKATFRNEIYPEYKANRLECPADLVPQMPYFRELSKALGLKVIEIPGFEADDIIGTFTECLKNSNSEITIITGDKDLTQLVTDKVTIWDTMKDRVLDVEGVKEKMGVYPKDVTRLLALSGDTSDNIPGITGVGPKTAVTLVEKFPTLEAIINNTSAIKTDKSIRNREKIAQQIESNPEHLRLSEKLVEVKKDIPIMLAIGDSLQSKTIQSLNNEDLLDFCKRSDPDQLKLKELIEKFSFQSLFANFNLALNNSNQNNQFKYTVVARDDFDTWLDKFKNVSAFALDLESTSLDVLTAKIIGAAICFEDDSAYYFPFGHKDKSYSQLSLDDFLKGLRAIFENEKIKKYGQNIKYDYSLLANTGCKLKGIEFDTMLASYLLHPDSGSHGLSKLSANYLGLSMTEYKDLVPKDSTFADVPIQKACDYACADAHFTWLLVKKLMPLLASNNLIDALNKIEVPLIEVIANMELAGIKLDVEFLKNMSSNLQTKLEKLEKEIYQLTGTEFNLNSPKQLAEILFNKLQIPTKGLKKTKTGISTDQSTLEKLSVAHPIAKLLLEYRLLYKLKSTYVDALPAQISSITNRLHTQFNQTITGTGRLSSSNPNLQNIPIQSEEGRTIRKAFVADTNKILLSADYSQIELRVLAHMSEDQALCAAFKNNLDIHATTARDILQVPKEREVNRDERRLGKTINFGIIYGISAFRLARELGVPYEQANLYIENYFKLYSGVKNYFEQTAKQGLEQGYVTTLFGRRRNLTEIDTRNRDKDFVRRVAINAPIQGTAADLVKLAMIKIYHNFTSNNLPIKMLLQIHDELVFECDSSFIETAKQLVKTEMENVYKLLVPLKVDLGNGANWELAH